MKELILLRHCKSSWSDPDAPDHDRPLNSRGHEAAPAIGRYLRDNDLLPDLILTSTAMRAIETMSLVTAGWPKVPPVIADRELYLTGRHANLSRIARVEDRWNRVMLIGHNPDIERLAISLASSGDKGALKSLQTKFPTGAFAVLSIPVDRWADLPTAIGKLERFVTPKDLSIS